MDSLEMWKMPLNHVNHKKMCCML